MLKMSAVFYLLDRSAYYTQRAKFYAKLGPGVNSTVRECKKIARSRLEAAREYRLAIEEQRRLSV